ncbi:MAG: hypothetical protein SGI92_33770 [Bryobacteraceae bacterium]|nr:hypothetical protein [Bryobacteraceae bacterium]
MNRRRFIATTALGALASRTLLARSLQPSTGTVTPAGKLVHDCGIPGQGRSNGAFPAHPNGIRLSRDRYLLLYATRGWRGVDEDRSIVYQVRSGAFNGPILKEALLAKSVDDWDPMGDGSKHFKAHGHPGGFGVPKGALIGGQLAGNANLFVLKWYCYARHFAGPDRLERFLAESSARLAEKTIRVQWVHARLNDAEDDIELLESVSSLRAPGFTELDPLAERNNQTYTQAQPFNATASEWIDQFMPNWPDPEQPTASGPVAIKFRYNPGRHRYEWVQTGPRYFPPGIDAIEGGLIRLDDGWAMYARPFKDANLPLLWVRMDDPFSRPAKKILAQQRAGQPIVRGPVTAYRCADGRIRVFTGSREISPYANRRHPLYCWEADPAADFALSKRQVVFDILATDPRIRPESEPIADMCKLLPHSGGSTQWIAHRFRTESINYRRERPASTNPEPQFQISPAVTDHEREAHGIYLARIDYGDSFPDVWDFPRPRSA